MVSTSCPLVALLRSHRDSLASIDTGVLHMAGGRLHLEHYKPLFLLHPQRFFYGWLFQLCAARSPRFLLALWDGLGKE